MTRTVSITGTPITVEDVVAVARGADVVLTDEAMAVLQASRRVVDEAVARGDAIYGVTTGVGHARDEVLPAESLEAMQPLLLDMHVGATGEALPPARVRAAMVVRLDGFARGGAGVSPAVAQRLTDLLHHGIHPVVPRSGSVGAGDLGQLALVGRTLLGRGIVEVDGRRVDAGRALADAGLDPVSLRPKDGLTLMSSNAVSIGHAALLVDELVRLAGLADLVAATSMDVVGANPSVVDPAVARAGASPGQRVTAATVRGALADRDATTGGVSVQDPLSFRVVPQVHGACRDTVARLREAVTAELGAASDNPLVDVASGRVVSNGNFHVVGLALAAESLRVALAHVGLLAERRMGHLWDAAVSSMGAQGPPPSAGGAAVPPALAGLGLRYPAAARYTRLRHLANPITLDVPVLDLAVEDHATNAPEALALVEEAIALVRELVVVELLVAVAARGPGDRGGRPGRGTGSLLALVAQVLDEVPGGSLPHEVLHRVSDRLDGHLDGLVARNVDEPTDW